MKLALFGATGRAGRHLLGQALEAGHEIVVFTRADSVAFMLQQAQEDACLHQAPGISN